MRRDNFKESIKAALRDRVAHRCSNPECRVPTAAPGSGATGVIRGGDAAHITAASPKGPRYDESISTTERSSIENGIWLCVVCARKIDHNRDAYPVELLREWKTSAETAAAQEFGKPLLTDAHLHTQTQMLITQQNQELLAQLKSIQANLANGRTSNQMGVEPLDHLLEALRRLVDSGKARGSAAMQLSSDGRYADAATEAIRLAEDEANAATYLGNAAEEVRGRAAARWRDAGDIAFISDRLQAANAYERSTEIDPSNPYGWSRLGEASWWVGRLDKALNAFTRMWYLMPEGVETLFGSGDPPEKQQARFMMDHPDITREAYIWVIRGIMIAGLNIIEILRREPSLVSKWVMRLVPVDQLDEPRALREPTEYESPDIVKFFSERVYNLGNVINVSAAPTEHRRILEGLARVATHRGELVESEEYLRRAHAMSVEQKDFVAEAVYLCNLGVVAGMRAQANTARDYFAQALALCKGDPRQGRLFVGTKLISVEEAARRREQHEQKLANGTAVASPDADEIEVCNLLADEFDRDPEVAMQRGLKLKETEGNAHANLGKLALVDGNLDLARQEFEVSLALHKSIGYSRGVAATRNAMLRLSQAETDAQD